MAWEHGIQQDTPEARQEFERLMEARRLEETEEAALKVFRRRWCLGSQEFRQRMLEQMEGKLGDHHSGELRRLGWTRDDLVVRPKSDPGKLAIAARLRNETTLPIKEIAFRVQLGTSKAANANLHKWMNSNTNDNPAQGQLGSKCEMNLSMG